MLEVEGKVYGEGKRTADAIKKISESIDELMDLDKILNSKAERIVMLRHHIKKELKALGLNLDGTPITSLKKRHDQAQQEVKKKEKLQARTLIVKKEKRKILIKLLSKRVPTYLKRHVKRKLNKHLKK